MNLISRIFPAAKSLENSFYRIEPSRNLPPGLFTQEHRFHVEKPHARKRAAALRALRVRNRFSEHLKAAADSEYGRTAGRKLFDRRLQAGFPQPYQVGNRAFRPRKHDKVRLPQLPYGGNIAQGDVLIALKRRKIREIGDARQSDHRDVDFLFHAVRQSAAEAVLVVDIRLHIRNDAGARHPDKLIQHIQPALQNRHVAAEFVDDRRFDSRALPRFKQRHGPVKLCEYAAAVDVADKQHRRVHHLRHPHVDDIRRFEVDFRRTSRALDDDDIAGFLQLMISRENVGNQLLLISKILRRAHVAAHLAVHNHLRADVRRRL